MNDRESSSQATLPPSHSSSQFLLMGQRRFAPFFWVQFLGAANDNVFKFAFTVMATYQLQSQWLDSDVAGVLIGAVFIAPFMLFSAMAGQLADKWAKTHLIRWVKNLEVLIMLIAALGFYGDSPAVLMLCTFLMGLHSTLFGPVKYAYLPQVLTPQELTGGNALVEMGTFVAILLGSLLGGMLINIPELGTTYVALTCLGLALVGRAAAQGVPYYGASDPSLRISLNPLAETLRNLRMAAQYPSVFRSLLGISWMWFFGAVFLTQFPNFAKDTLHGDVGVASLLLAVFSVGIGVGSLLCETLGRKQVEIGLVPLGALGMSVFTLDLYWAVQNLQPVPLQGVSTFLQNSAHWRVMLDLALLSLCAGLYSVPMYALIQLRAPATHRARIIAANNILNALFMVLSAVLVTLCLHLGWSVAQIFLAVGILNAIVATYIFRLVPEYLLRFVAWVLSHIVYRFRMRGHEHIPATGAAILACNHVSFIDAVLLMAASPRPVVFLMDHRVFRTPVIGALFRWVKAIPIAPQKEDPAAYEAAFERAAQVLREGDLLGIFPEGAITRDGQMQDFKGGIVKIVRRAQNDGLDIPVIPMALTNLWGSYFSRIEQGQAMKRPFRRGLFNPVGLEVGEPLWGQDITPAILQERVEALLESGEADLRQSA